MPLIHDGGFIKLVLSIRNMRINDRVYGTIEPTDAVIIDLVNSPVLQRLKGIDQAGYAKPYFPGAEHTRFEHSLGVYEILRRYNAPLEEQVAGLIHDVSHTAFSHCIDYVLAEKAEEEAHQDKTFAAFVKSSAMPSILRNHNINIKYILNDKNFPLKETNLPDICADRIDYSLRTARVHNEITQRGVKNLLSHLQVHDRMWVFQGAPSARGYAELFKKMNDKYYAGFPSAVMFRTVGDYLRYALQQGYIDKRDLYATDREVLERIEQHQGTDSALKMLWQRMNMKAQPAARKSEADARVKCKSRVVDPLCWNKGAICRLSDAEPDWKLIVQQEMRPKEHFIKFNR